MNCQAKSETKAPKVSPPAAVLGGCALLSLAPPETAGTCGQLRRPPAHLLGFLSSPPDTALRQRPGMFHARWRCPPEIFSKQGPKVWSRAAVFRCTRSAVLQVNKMKAIWSLLGEETKIKRNADLAPEHVGASARGYTAGREEMGLRQRRDLWSGTMEEFHL